ncbi:MAG: sigma-70 family RNA polymerase sigma factor [Planctomycetota bacterium]|nr:MAG: sigma-70 family RNA polymerase sigma factor [Planctomycetota bacterium]
MRDSAVSAACLGARHRQPARNQEAAMPNYRSNLLADLAGQLLRGPKRLRLRQLRGIEFLLSVIEPDKSYPFDFVLHALTGYRRSVSEHEAKSTTLRGTALRDDLVLLAEQLSTDARICAECWPQRVWTIRELAQRFGVSNKTISRWHKRGLLGWRFVFDDHRLRLAFPERAVQRFVAEHVDLVNRGRSFSQLTDDERAAIIARARQLVGDEPETVNAIAKTISVETGRAVETIRLILKTYDEAHPGAGVFNRTRLRVPVDDVRLKVWAAYVEGGDVQSLAQRFDRDVREIYAIVTEMRARDMKSRPIEFVPSDEFELPDADRVCLEDPALRSISAECDPPQRIPPELPPYLRQLFRIPLLTKEQEVALFRKMNYLRYKAARRLKALDPESATAAELDAIEALVDQANAVKNQITQANLRLVVSIARRHANPRVDFFELVSDGNISLMRAVDRFDYSRGFKFSTYASWAIMKNFARSVPEDRTRRQRFQTGRDELLETVAMPALDEFESEQHAAVRSTVERMLATLDDRDREILRLRFGLDNCGVTQTLEQLGRRFGVSKERVRQLEKRAMHALRNAFADRASLLLSR